MFLAPHMQEDIDTQHQSLKSDMSSGKNLKPRGKTNGNKGARALISKELT